MVLKPLFWVSAGVLGWVYGGYPAAAAAAAVLRREPPLGDGPSPSLSVAIAVHQAADQIEERVRDIFAQDLGTARLAEVIVGVDGNSDETAAVVRRLAEAEPRLRLLELPRAGQTPTQHALFGVATGDIVVLTDAEARFAPGCLAALAAAFRDPRVGCATGKLVWQDVAGSATIHSEGIYWRYELLVRELESRAGWLTAVTGAIVAVRRDAYRPVPARSSMDELLPIYVREQGGQVVFVPEAIATDRPLSSIREQFGARTRIATRGIAGNLAMLRRPAIRRQPGPVLAIVSHKLLRWATPWAVVAMALAGLGLARRPGSRGYVVAPAGLAAAAVLAVGAEVQAVRGRRPGRVAAFARSFGVVNLAFAISWLNVLRGRRYETWTPAASTTPVATPSAPEPAPVGDLPAERA